MPYSFFLILESNARLLATSDLRAETKKKKDILKRILPCGHHSLHVKGKIFFPKHTLQTLILIWREYSRVICTDCPLMWRRLW